MAIEILRKCAQCKTLLGCYSPEKRDCAGCSSPACPDTPQETHTLCPACFEEAARAHRLWSANAGKKKVKAQGRR